MWFIHDTISDRLVHIPKWVFISGRTIKQLKRKFYNEQLTVGIAAIHSHQIELIPFDESRQDESEL